MAIFNPAIDNILFSRGDDPAGATSQLVRTLITIGFVIGILAFFVYFIIGAIKWISSQGDKGRVQEAKSQISHALIGLVILLSLYIIVSLIGNIFSIDLLNLPLNLNPSAQTCTTPPCPI